jgi:quinol-cytochrome oxidoreductase complex cytochrome b subunit
MTGSKWIIGLIAFFVVFASTVSGKKLIYKLTALGAYEIHDQIVLTIKLNSDSTFIGTLAGVGVRPGN